MNPTLDETAAALRIVLTAAKSASSPTDDLLANVGPSRTDAIAAGPLPFSRAAEVDANLAALSAAEAAGPVALLGAVRGAFAFLGIG